jgi:hypothetical protein
LHLGQLRRGEQYGSGTNGQAPGVMVWRRPGGLDVRVSFIPAHQNPITAPQPAL